MTVEVGILLAAVAGLIGVATFYAGRRSAAKNDGMEWGELKSDIKHIKEDMAEIRSDVKDTKNDYLQELADQRKEFKESIRRLHKRIDDHEREYHNKIVTRNEDSEV